MPEETSIGTPGGNVTPYELHVGTDGTPQGNKRLRELYVGTDGTQAGTKRVFSLAFASPSNPTATALDAHTIRVTHAGDSDDVDSYKVYWRAGASMAGNTANADGSQDIGSATSWDHGQLLDDTTYYYLVVAVRYAEESAPGTEVSDTTPVAAPTVAPQWRPGFPRDKASDDTSIELQSQAPPDGDSVDVYYRIGSSMGGDPVANGTLLGNFTLAQIVSAIYAHDTGQAHGTVVYYQHRGRNAGGPGPFGAEASAAVQMRLPGAPTNVSAAVNMTTLVATITWGAGSPDNEANYELQERSRPCGGTWGSWSTKGSPGQDVLSAQRGVLEGNEYEWQVKASNAAGDSAYVQSNSVEVGTVPLAPGWETGYPQKNGANPTSALDLAWSGDVAAWDIQYRTQGGSFPGTPQVEGYAGAHTPGSPYVLSGLIDATTYEVQVRGVDPCKGPGPWSSIGSAATDMAPPTVAPQWATGFPRDKASDDTSIELQSQAPPDGDSVDVYYRVGSSMGGDPVANGTLLGNFTLAQIVSAIYAHDTGQAHGTVIYYQHRGRNAGGSGPFSAEVSVSVQKRVPGDPANVSASVNMTTLVATITWTQGAPDNETGYTVQERSRPCGGAFGSWSTVGDLPADDLDHTRVVIEGREYEWQVKASNEAGDNASGYIVSNAVTVSTTPGVPVWTGGYPVRNATNPDSAVDLSWGAVSGTVDGYDVQYRIQGAGWPGTPQVQGNVGTTLTVTGLADNTTYEFQVRGMNNCGGTSAWSSTGTVTTDFSAPTQAPTLTATPTQATDDKVDLDTGLGVPDATGYDYDRAPDVSGSPGTWTNIVTDHPNPNYQDTGRSPDTKYWYRARGRNPGGTGPWSTSQAATTHLQSPSITSVQRDLASCPTLVLNVVVSHQNSAGDARFEAFDVEYWDGAWNAAPSQTAGTTNFQVTVNGSTTKLRTRYQSESAWSEKSFSAPVCPE